MEAELKRNLELVERNILYYYVFCPSVPTALSWNVTGLVPVKNSGTLTERKQFC